MTPCFLRNHPLTNKYTMNAPLTIPILVSTLAPIINCIQLLPQLYKTYITKSSKDLSIYSLLLILGTNLLWLLHGYFIMDTSLLVASSIALAINMSLFVLVLYERRK